MFVYPTEPYFATEQLFAVHNAKVGFKTDVQYPLLKRVWDDDQVTSKNYPLSIGQLWEDMMEHVDVWAALDSLLTTC